MLLACTQLTLIAAATPTPPPPSPDWPDDDELAVLVWSPAFGSAGVLAVFGLLESCPFAFWSAFCESLLESPFALALVLAPLLTFAVGQQRHGLAPR